MSTKQLNIAFHNSYIHPLPKGHRFPMIKYELLANQLIHEGTALTSNFFLPHSISEVHLKPVHDPLYLKRLIALQLNSQEQRLSGFVHNAQLIERERRIMEGTRKCAELALENKIAMNIAGGTHHAFSNRAEGFCLLNDQAIAAKWLLNSNKAKRILILDLDVHQGNGTAAIFKEDVRVFTLSIHGKNNYPLRKENSDLDIELEDGTSDNEYHYELERNLSQVIETFNPDFVFYQSGVDVLESDKLGRLALTRNGCKIRDKIVFNYINQLNIPITCSMGGGYGEQLKEIIEAHANTFRVAQEVFF